MKRAFTFSCVSLFAVSLVLMSCGKKGDSGASGTEKKADTAATATKDSASAPAMEPGKIPFDFPTVATTAKKNDVVLTPSLKFQEDAAKDASKATFIFYDAVMDNPGAVESDVKFTFDGVKKVPNAYIIPIPAGQTAKTGDILLTWWQSGSGMQRAIVTDGSNPSEPVVRYLDLDFDNPAKASDGKTSIGQMEEKLKPNTFVKINAEMEPGTGVAVREGSDYKIANVIRVEGDKVFILGFAGRPSVVAKSDCVALPLKPDVKVGDNIKVPFAASFTDGTVTKIDARLGVVFVKTKYSNDKDEPISFGNIALKF